MKKTFTRFVSEGAVTSETAASPGLEPDHKGLGLALTEACG